MEGFVNQEESILFSVFLDVNRGFLMSLKDDIEIEVSLDFGVETEMGLINFDMSQLKPFMNIVMESENVKRIYEALLDGLYFTSSLDLQDILITLCKYYILAHNHQPDLTYNILIKENKSYIYKFFKTNISFGMKLLSNYYMAKMYNVNDLDYTMPEEMQNKYDDATKTMIITDYIRYGYERCINELFEKGLSQEDIINVVFLILTDRDDLVINGELVKGKKFLKSNKRLITRLIYADVYEDSVNWDTDDKEMKFLQDNIDYCIDNNKYMLPNNHISIDLIERFTDLVFDPATREYNRNSLSNTGISFLKKANPAYLLERVMIGYENK